MATTQTQLNIHLLEAIEEGRSLSYIDKLIKRGADISSLNVSSLDEFIYDWSPLTLAIHMKRPNVALHLLKKGANPNIVSSFNISPLSRAVIGGYTELVVELINHGAIIDMLDMMGNTPLMRAIKLEHPKMVETLIKLGADVSFVNYSGETPLSKAVGNAEIVRLIKNAPFQRAHPYLSFIFEHKDFVSSSTGLLIAIGVCASIMTLGTASVGIAVTASIASGLTSSGLSFFALTKLEPQITPPEYNSEKESLAYAEHFGSNFLLAL